MATGQGRRSARVYTLDRVCLACTTASSPHRILWRKHIHSRRISHAGASALPSRYVAEDAAKGIQNASTSSDIGAPAAKMQWY